MITSKRLLELLNAQELGAYLYKQAASGSYYIKFNTYINGSLRVSNHEQRARYAYRWNLREDLKEVTEELRLGHVCTHYPKSHIREMIIDMVATAKINNNLSQNTWLT